MYCTFDLVIDYTTIAVFDPRLEMPFNDWRQQHIAQGFSWRPGSVSFGTLYSDNTTIIASQSDSIHFQEACLRAILVPFEVMENGEIEIATISEGRVLRVEAGLYKLLYQLSLSDNHQTCNFIFAPSNELVEPVVLKADDKLHPTHPLLMEANPAVR